MRAKSPADFYVYVLFDQFGIPRYVGKGRGRRIDDHGRDGSTSNQQKCLFIKATINAIGEIPRTKIRENLSEAEALKLERVFIHAIGREPDGPLTNATAGGQGLSGYRPTPETLAKLSANSKRFLASLSPDSRIARATHASLSLPPEVRSANARDRWSRRSRADRSAIVKKGHEALTPDERSERQRLRWEGRSASQRSEIYGKTLGTISPEERKETGKKGAAALTFEQRSAAGKRCAISMTDEQKRQRAINGWITRRAKAAPSPADPIPSPN